MAKFSILIVEDDQRLGEELSEYLQEKEHRVKLATTPSEALALAEQEVFNLGLFDIRLPEYDGLALFKKLKPTQNPKEVVMMSGHGDMESVIQALRLGAYDYLQKPFSPPVIDAVFLRFEKTHILQASVEQLKSEAHVDLIIGTSPKMAEVKQQLYLAAQVKDSSVLILGESGTGKELAARYLHDHSQSSQGPFVAVNCPAIPPALLESEFFGYETGAFTDAKSPRLGFIRSAQGGTLFLDEIGDLPLDLQSKLLRVLETQKLRPLGTDREEWVDFRLLTATNKNLLQLVQDGKFRSDLYYRLAVVEITMPPLRDIPSDIAAIFQHYWAKFEQKMGRPASKVPPQLLRALEKYPFPGNVRELKNIVERSLILGVDKVLHSLTPAPTPATSPSLSLKENQKRLIREALLQTNNNHSKAARLLGVSRQALERKLKSLSD